MHHHYRDILDRVTEPPVWFDEHAVPRFGQFSPDEIANIYADEAVLMLITCQACGHPYNVAMSLSRTDRILSALGRSGVTHVEKPGEREHYGTFSRRKMTAEESAEVDRIAAERSLAAQIREKSIHYGDPPNACPGGCSGATMNSEPRRIIEYWRKGEKKDGKQWRWVREHALEIDVQPDWVETDGATNK